MCDIYSGSLGPCPFSNTNATFPIKPYFSSSHLFYSYGYELRKMYFVLSAKIDEQFQQEFFSNTEGHSPKW